MNATKHIEPTTKGSAKKPVQPDKVANEPLETRTKGGQIIKTWVLPNGTQHETSEPDPTYHMLASEALQKDNCPELDYLHPHYPKITIRPDGRPRFTNINGRVFTLRVDLVIGELIGELEKRDRSFWQVRNDERNAEAFIKRFRPVVEASAGTDPVRGLLGEMHHATYLGVPLTRYEAGIQWKRVEVTPEMDLQARVFVESTEANGGIVIRFADGSVAVLFLRPLPHEADVARDAYPAARWELEVLLVDSCGADKSLAKRPW